MILRNAIPGVLMWLTLALPGFSADAKTNDPSEIPDRYLLIVDTSSPMRSRARAAEESIAALLESGIQSQISNGDQLGLWTFNNDLHTEFDLVIWDDSIRENISSNILAFLDKQRFRKSTDFSTVMPHLLDVVADSKRVTVILVSDGDETIQGTPFDDAIAAYYRENAEVTKDKRTPIITVLRGYEGTLINHSVSYPPWPIEFAVFPPEPEPEPAPEPAVAKTNVVATPSGLSRTLMTTNTGPIVFGEPLIVRGSSRDELAPARTQGQTNSLTGGTNMALNTSAQSTAVSVTNETNEVAAIVPGSAQNPQAPGADGERRSLRWGYVIIPAFGVVALAVVFAGVVRMRRSRSRQRASLITRSMDKKSGPK